LIGDSFSKDLLQMILEAQILPGADIRVRSVPAACQIYRGKEDALAMVEAKSRATCKDEVYYEAFYPEIDALIQKADLVILAGRWFAWSAERLPETLENFHFPPTTRVIVLGRKDFGHLKLQAWLGMPPERKAQQQNRVRNDHLRINARMAEKLANIPGIEFVDLHALVCGKDAPTCPIFTPQGRLISYDGYHLTQMGARWLGEKLAQHPAFVQARGSARTH
jgi:hypothetical protein